MEAYCQRREGFTLDVTKELYSLQVLLLLYTRLTRIEYIDTLYLLSKSLSNSEDVSFCVRVEVDEVTSTQFDLPRDPRK